MNEMVNCLSCGRLEAVPLADHIVCQHCGYSWLYEDEQRMAGYLKRVFGREPVSPPGAVEMKPPPVEEPVQLTGDLTDINGIGRATVKLLKELGIVSIADLAEVQEPDILAYAIRGATEDDVTGWIEQARALLDG